MWEDLPNIQTEGPADQHNTRQAHKECKMDVAKEYVREFTDGTTLHGVRYVAEPLRHWTERLFWVGVMCACCVLCGLEMSKVWNRWSTAPILVSMSPNLTPVDQIPFPAVTLCVPPNLERVADQLEQYFEPLRGGDVRLKQNISVGDLAAAHAVASLCSLPTKRLGFLNNTIDLNQSEYIKVLGELYRFEFIIISPSGASIKRSVRSGSPIRDLFKPSDMVRDKKLCFTYNGFREQDMFAGGSSEDKVPEYIYRVPRVKDQVKIWINYLNVTVQDSVLLRSCQAVKKQTAMELFIHNPGEYIDTWAGKSVELVKDKITNIILKPRIYSASPDIQRYPVNIRSCLFSEDIKLKYLKHYTTSNCLMDLRESELRKNCNCSVHGSSETKVSLDFCFNTEHRLYSYYCFIQYNSLVGSFGHSQCLPGCEETNWYYDVDFSSVPAALPPYSSFFEIKIGFEELQLTTFQRNEVYSLTDVLSSCGGLLGLFTGFSVITMAEILYFATLRLLCRLRTRHTTQANEESAKIKNDELSLTTSEKTGLEGKPSSRSDKHGGRACVLVLVLLIATLVGLAAWLLISNYRTAATKHRTMEGLDLQANDETESQRKLKEQLSELNDAVRKGNLSTVKHMLELGVGPNVEFNDIVPPLGFAADNGHLDIVKLLIEKGADVRHSDRGRQTALHFAATKGHVDIARLLLDNGAECEARDKDDYTPLMTAATNAHWSMVQLLVQRNCDVHAKAFTSGYTPLHFASKKNSAGSVHYLLEANARVNKRTRSGETPLFLTTSLTVMSNLLSHGASVKVKTVNGISILHKVIGESLNSRRVYTSIFSPKAGSLDAFKAVRLLLSYGADAAVQDDFRKTPLDLAVQYRMEDVVQLLNHTLNYKAESNLPRAIGNQTCPGNGNQTALDCKE